MDVVHEMIPWLMGSSLHYLLCFYGLGESGPPALRLLKVAQTFGTHPHTSLKYVLLPPMFFGRILFCSV